MIVVTLEDEIAKNFLKELEGRRWDLSNPSLQQNPLVTVYKQIEEQLISQAKAQTKGEDRDI